MSASDDDDEDQMLVICAECVGEAFLSREVGTEGREGKCSYCGKDGKCLGIVAIADRIETAFSEHYIRTSCQPDSFQSMMLADRESNYDWNREGEPVACAIADAADIPASAATNVLEILEDRNYDHGLAKMDEESDFSSDSYYEEAVASDTRWQEDWRAFERSLKEEARFFSSAALTLLREVFSDIESLKAKGGRSPIVDAGPGTDLTSLFRARAFQSDDQLKLALARPDLRLGSPPTGLAKAGRMNAQGISVFYGSNSAAAALAEVRPPVGCKVATGRFEILRPLRLLDLAALGAVAAQGSVFDPKSKSLFERIAFLRTLSQLITIPVMPDNDAADYLATQAIADFLATESDPPFDGLIFSSVQHASNSLNIVLFHRAARVEKLEISDDSEVDVSLYRWTDDGADPDFTVYEEVPAADDLPEPKTLVSGVEWNDWEREPDSLDSDPRAATLRY